MVQLTPPGSNCSLQIGQGVTNAPAGTLCCVYLVVTDVEATRTLLVERGVQVGEIRHKTPIGLIGPIKKRLQTEFEATFARTHPTRTKHLSRPGERPSGCVAHVRGVVMIVWHSPVLRNHTDSPQSRLKLLKHPLSSVIRVVLLRHNRFNQSYCPYLGNLSAQPK